MKRNGHIGAGFITTAPVVYLSLINETLIMAILAILLTPSISTLPDIDVKISLLKHRGITHTFIIAFIVSAIVTTVFSLIAYLTTLSQTAFLPKTPLFISLLFSLFFFPWISHILTDSLTKTGTTPFWPISNAKLRFDVSIVGRQILPIRYDNTTVNWLFSTLGTLSILAAIYYSVAYANIELIQMIQTNIKSFISILE